MAKNTQQFAQESFTAFDITKALRKSENVLHDDVRNLVHVLMQDYIQ